SCHRRPRRRLRGAPGWLHLPGPPRPRNRGWLQERICASAYHRCLRSVKARPETPRVSRRKPWAWSTSSVPPSRRRRRGGAELAPKHASRVTWNTPYSAVVTDITIPNVTFLDGALDVAIPYRRTGDAFAQEEGPPCHQRPRQTHPPKIPTRKAVSITTWSSSDPDSEVRSVPCVSPKRDTVSVSWRRDVGSPPRPCRPPPGT